MTADEAMAHAKEHARGPWRDEVCMRALVDEIESLRVLIRQTIAEHNNGHSPCNCVELAAELGIKFPGDE